MELKQLKHCGACGEMVDPNAGPHTHEMKTCKKCEELLPADAFGLHQSSTDGRRHVCLQCVADQSATARVQRAVAKDKQFRDNKEKLKEHRYRWVRRIVHSGPDPVFRWALLDPQGEEVSMEQALRDIAIAENPEPDDFDYPLY
ncbi:MAG: hypothetical protein ACLGIS_09175 [Actinomycetes bacterium]